MTRALSQESSAATTDGDDLDHWYCPCNPDVAFCGCDVSNAPVDLTFEEASCVVCEDLYYLPCRFCGAVAL